MLSSKRKIISDINYYIQISRENSRNWYVGVSKDACNSLFCEHMVKEKDSWWLYKQAYSSQSAREVRDYFIKILGTDGNTDSDGDGDDTADMIYAYIKTKHTKPGLCSGSSTCQTAEFEQ